MIFAKVLAGLLMYLIFFLPLALLIIARLNTPGVWPGPIYAYMFLPLLAHFLAGAMFYVATFLSAFRPARWYATKWLPLLAAVPAYIAADVADPYLRVHYFHVHWLYSWSLYELLAILALVPLNLALVLWAIREQARTREY